MTHEGSLTLGVVSTKDHVGSNNRPPDSRILSAPASTTLYIIYYICVYVIYQAASTTRHCIQKLQRFNENIMPCLFLIEQAQRLPDAPSFTQAVRMLT